MGFFGQPLAVAAGAGIGPSGGNAQSGAIGAGTGLTTPAGGGLFGTSTTSGSTDAGASSTPPAGGTAGGTDANGNPTTSGGQTGGTAGSSQAGGASTGGSSSTSSPTSGQTFGGGGIIGFSPQSPKQSLYVYKKKNHYNEWEFLYSPLMDQQTMAGGNTGTIGQPASGTTTPDWAVDICAVYYSHNTEFHDRQPAAVSD